MPALTPLGRLSLLGIYVSKHCSEAEKERFETLEMQILETLHTDRLNGNPYEKQDPDTRDEVFAPAKQFAESLGIPF